VRERERERGREGERGEREGRATEREGEGGERETNLPNVVVIRNNNKFSLNTFVKY